MSKSVYIASCLPTDKDTKGHTYGRSVFQGLKNLFGDRLRLIESHKNNVWCRDYMPVRSATGRFVQFRYAPAYMTDTEKWRKRIPDASAIHAEIPFLQNCHSSDIVLDGGAIERSGSRGIVSDRVFRDNPDRSEQELLSAIKSLLELDALIVIPQHPYDFTGHVDGLVRFIDPENVVINDHTEELKKAQSSIREKKNYYRGRLIENWYYAFVSALYNSNLNVRELPCTVAKNKNDQDGTGIYLNFLLLDDVIVMPTYKDPENDQKAKNLLRAYYHKDVIGIDACVLAREGGMINCVTWEG